MNKKLTVGQLLGIIEQLKQLDSETEVETNLYDGTWTELRLSSIKVNLETCAFSGNTHGGVVLNFNRVNDE
jgi:hypothetical protein